MHAMFWQHLTCFRLIERQQVAIEILRRSTGANDLPEAALHEMAAELFRSYDGEEAARAES